MIGTLAVLTLIQFVNFVGASRGFAIGEVQGAEREETRFFGPLGDSIGVVLLLGYTTSLCFRSAVGIGAFMGGILLTAGLGAILSTAVSTVIFLLVGTRPGGIGAFAPLKLRLMPILVLAGLGAVALVTTPLAQTLIDRLSTGNAAGSGSQRLDSATLAGEMIADNPLLGVGYMGYLPALPYYGGAKVFNLERPDGGQANANNQILQALTDAGVAGLLASGLFFFYAARLLFTVAARSPDPFFSTFYLAAFIWLLTQLLANLATAWLVPGSFVARFLWILLGIALAVERLLPQLARRKAELAEPGCPQAQLAPS
ncbi:MAG: O-antigen ligase family protein [Verrucomicrobiota bacterium]|nr:O-antigen ligase family protein [Verrucomicrobiota bacterium]